MAVINQFLQENKQRIIAFLDEMSASSFEIIYHADNFDNIMWYIFSVWEWCC